MQAVVTFFLACTRCVRTACRSEMSFHVSTSLLIGGDNNRIERNGTAVNAREDQVAKPPLTLCLIGHKGFWQNYAIDI